MPVQQSANVAQGGTIFSDDHNRIVTDVGAIIAEKGAANGYAPLGADSKVPSANLPAAILDDGSVTTAKLAANAATNAKTTVLSFTNTGLGLSTSAGAFVNIPNLSIGSFVTSGGPILVEILTTAHGLGTGNAFEVGVNIGGIDYTMGVTVTPANGGQLRWSGLITGVVAGTYTVQARIKNANTSTSYSFVVATDYTYPKHAEIIAVEYKR